MVRVCTVNLTFSFSLSASEISTCRAFSPRTAGVAGAEEELSGDVADPLPFVAPLGAGAPPVAGGVASGFVGEAISIVAPLLVEGLLSRFESSVPSYGGQNNH